MVETETETVAVCVILVNCISWIPLNCELSCAWNTSGEIDFLFSVGDYFQYISWMKTRLKGRMNPLIRWRQLPCISGPQQEQRL